MVQNTVKINKNTPLLTRDALTHSGSAYSLGTPVLTRDAFTDTSEFLGTALWQTGDDARAVRPGNSPECLINAQTTLILKAKTEFHVLH